MSNNLLILDSLYDMYDNVEHLIDAVLKAKEFFALVYLDGQKYDDNIDVLRSRYFMKASLKSIPAHASEYFKDKIICLFADNELSVKKYEYLECNKIFISEILNIEEMTSNPAVFTISLKYADYLSKKALFFKLENVLSEAHISTQQKEYLNASRQYVLAAETMLETGISSIASKYYALAAIMSEKMEDWRRISFLWYKAYCPDQNESLEYTDFNTLEHNYPTILFDKWITFSDEEKKARALQYAAYSEDNYNGPVDSYWLYEEAAKAYSLSGNVERMIECLTSATNRYITAYHRVDQSIVSQWEKILTDKSSEKYYELLHISLEEIYRNFDLYEVTGSEFFFIQAKKIELKKLKLQHKWLKLIRKGFWSWLTCFGLSIKRIVLISSAMVFVLFPLIYKLLLKEQCFLLCIKKSLNVFFNISFEINVCPECYAVQVAETLFSYMVLAIISSYYISKLLREHG